MITDSVDIYGLFYDGCLDTEKMFRKAKWKNYKKVGETAEKTICVACAKAYGITGYRWRIYDCDGGFLDQGDITICLDDVVEQANKILNSIK